MESWLSEGLHKILEFQIPEELIQHIVSIQQETSLEEYMKTLLDLDNPQHKNFYLDVVNKKFPNRGSTLGKQKKKISKNNKDQHDFVSGDVEQSPSKEHSKSKKSKFVNLYSKEGKDAQVVMLKGRRMCECEASKHELINNCLQCGRIVCTQEGSGPCMCCGVPVYTEEEEDQILLHSRTGIIPREKPKGLEAAIAHRNKLLEYDRSDDQRRVIDDDCDYFQTNTWLSHDERDKLEQYHEQLQEKKHASRLDRKMNFDFAGRQIVEDMTIDYDVDVDKIEEITRGKGTGWNAKGSSQNGAAHEMMDISRLSLKHDPPMELEGPASRNYEYLGAGGRVQDPLLLEMSDQGKCLSMHQPWASLLVEGIKMHEGRTWYTSHRGRLWIASTAKPPEPEAVRALEAQYSAMNPDKELKFPSFYPAGCLLGFVQVDDCLPQEEYLKRYPDGESGSPYVLICSEPTSLRLRFPIKGQHKIYSLDKAIHRAALINVQSMAKIRSEDGEFRPTL